MKKSVLVTLSALIFLSTGVQQINAGLAEDYKKQINSDVKIVNEQNVVHSFKDIAGHWSESSILEALKQGLVSGYPDGLFHPENKVTRAEFIKMTVSALKLPVDTGVQPAHWYDLYVNSAKTGDIYKDNDFSSTDLTKTMTRVEMAHIAVRSIGETAKDDNEFMYIATKKGLISGTGKGKLDPQGTTTRAQAVTVVQRIQQIKNGHTLPVDELAVANAEKEMKAKKDQWGRTIRTTNLPKNFKDYPYILADIPNEMYEMQYPYSRKTNSKTSSVLYSTKPEFTKKNIDIWMGHATKYGSLLLNVDYTTINDKWVNDMFDTMKKEGGNVEQKKYIKRYRDWVIENKIKVTGSLVPEQSMIYNDGHGNYYVRAKVKFKMTSFKKNENLIFDTWYPNGEYKLNKWYSGYTDIALNTNVGGDWGDTLNVSYNASVFRNCLIHEE